MKNKLLLRQIEKYYGKPDKIPEDLHQLFKAISKSYDHGEKSRKVLERAIDISSSEMNEINARLRKNEENNRAIFKTLKESLEIINDDTTSYDASDHQMLLLVSERLTEETQKRKLAEKELEESKTFLQTSQRVAHTGSWELDMTIPDDPYANTLTWSDETYRIFGFEPGSVNVSSDFFFSRVHPDDQQSITDAVSKAIETEGVYSIEHRILLPDGQEKIVHERSEITYDEKTKLPVKMIGTVQDITKRKQAENALKDSEYKFRSLIENSSDCITVINANRDTIFASNSIYSITGYTAEETAGKSSLTYVHPEDIAALDKHFEKVFQNPGVTLPIIYRRLKKDGNYIWCEGRATNLLNDPAVKGIVINFRDITERKNAEKALQDSEYRFRTLLEHSSDFITVINEKQEIIYASDTLFRITGYKPDEVVNKPGLMFIHPDDRAKVGEDLQELIDKPGKPILISYRIIKKDGTPLWVERIATNLLHEPTIGGIVSNFRDITAHKEYEEALVASNDDLKKTNMELDKFVYSVSHDLRAPLASMAGIIDLLKSDISDEDSLEKMAFLEGSIKKLDSFIQDILDYSRNARLEVQIEEINFKELLVDITDNLKFMGMEKDHNKVEIKVNLYNGISFHSDRHRIGVILSNLISNAIRYKNPDITNPFVEIVVKPSDKNVVIAITDNGIGISKENHEKIFEMFYRLSKNSVGSGLGLYIVKETIEKLQGNITVESEPGKGSKFTISIPNLNKN